MIIQQGSNGNWYIARVPPGGGRKGNFRNWWMVKAQSSGSAYVPLRGLTLPKSFLGKKVRFKLEFVDEEDNNVINTIDKINLLKEEIERLKNMSVSEVG